MTPRRATAAAAAALVAAVAGCGFGAGERDEGVATITVTRDFGAEEMTVIDVEDPAESDTVMRVLDRSVELRTRYGGGFVQAIDGVAGGRTGGRTHDWFYYVDGIEASVGAAEWPLRAGQRVWWDHRDWTTAMRVPAVVGSFPEPFLQAAAEPEERLEVRVECAGTDAACDAAAEALADAGVEAERAELGSPGGEEALRVVVGEWDAVRGDDVAALLERDPAESGVFARFEGEGGEWELVALDERAEPAASVPADAGLVAALRAGEEPPTWVVTGASAEAVEAAAGALDEEALRNRYAVAVADGAPVPLPVGEGAP
jgi:hypothetical protein